ncbi:MAG: hypothetical protein AAFO03_26455 [Bacteroidota bacterium]
MLVTKTKAAELAGVSRRTFYNHIPEKRISITKDEEGNEKIDVSELERVYGLEVVRGNMKKVEDAHKEVSNNVQSAHSFTQKPVQLDLLIAQEKLSSAQQIIEQLRNEREHLITDKEKLQKQLDRALAIGEPIGKLLTDQSQHTKNLVAIERSKIEVQKKKDEAERRVGQYAKRHKQNKQKIEELEAKLKAKEDELSELRSASVFKKLFSSK